LEENKDIAAAAALKEKTEKDTETDIKEEQVADSEENKDETV
jgi:hypothetical protein